MEHHTALPAGLPRAALLLPGLLHRDAGRLLTGVLAPGVRHEGGPGQVLQLYLPPPLLVRLLTGGTSDRGIKGKYLQKLEIEKNSLSLVS